MREYFLVTISSWGATLSHFAEVLFLILRAEAVTSATSTLSPPVQDVTRTTQDSKAWRSTYSWCKKCKHPVARPPWVEPNNLSTSKVTHRWVASRSPRHISRSHLTCTIRTRRMSNVINTSIWCLLAAAQFSCKDTTSRCIEGSTTGKSWAEQSTVGTGAFTTWWTTIRRTTIRIRAWRRTTRDWMPREKVLSSFLDLAAMEATSIHRSQHSRQLRFKSCQM